MAASAPSVHDAAVAPLFPRDLGDVCDLGQSRFQSHANPLTAGQPDLALLPPPPPSGRDDPREGGKKKPLNNYHSVLVVRNRAGGFR